MPNEEMKVLVIEDEESFITALKVGLTREGFTVEVQSDGAEALNTFKTFNPDIVLLDLMLPNRSGVDICRDIREIAKTPIIMVTAKSEEIDTVLGLEVGADDYISKPYRLHELIARMRAQLRRANWGDEPVAPYQIEKTTIGDITIDPNRHEVFKGDTQITLSIERI